MKKRCPSSPSKNEICFSVSVEICFSVSVIICPSGGVAE